MTYQEAADFKAQLKAHTYQRDGEEFIVLITPQKESDLTPYLDDIRMNIDEVTDENAISYSSNAQFAVTGIWTDGSIITHQQIVINNHPELF